MSIAVELADLPDTIAARGPAAFLITVRDTRPHIVSVSVSVTPATPTAVLVVGAGRRTSVNIETHAEITLLWPYTVEHPGHSLLVDGVGVLAADGEHLEITPTKAILHRAGGRRRPPR